ncbi:sensor histidine kinase [Tenacibaculum sp. 190524A02b]|uniref:tetratricopeptide repeat-containing sensor histidine kinase n=1 Tax=Tenacibaculum vairaonense TaxID=3137860 RepID=UPI0031FB788A
MKKYFILSFLILSIKLTYSQKDNDYNTLKEQLTKATTDEQKVLSLVALAEYLVYRDFSEAEGKALKAISIVKSNSKLLKEGGLGFPYNILGIIKRKQGDYANAVNFFLKAKDAFSIVKDSSNIANTMHNLGMVYRSIKNYPKSIESYQKAISILEKLGKNKKGLAASYNMLGVSYRKMKQLDKALTYYQKAQKLFTELNSEEDLYRVKGNLSVLHTIKKEYSKSLQLNLDRLNYYTKVGNKASIISTNYNISGVYKKLKDWKNALKHANTSVKMAKAEGIKPSIPKYYKRISRIYAKQNKFQKALENYKLYKIYSDSLINDENLKKIQRLELESKFRKEKINDSLQLVKERKIAETNAEVLFIKNKLKSQWMLFGGLFFLSLFLIYYFIQSRNFAIKKQKLQAEFTRNLIKGQEEERNRIARELHDSVGQKLVLLSKKSQHENSEFNKIVTNTLTEVRSLSRGLYPANIDTIGVTAAIKALINEIDANTNTFFTNDIDNIDDQLNKTTSLHLYRIIQEALNNIIKHSEAKSVSITIQRKNNFINTTIKDNGIGFQFQEKLKQPTSLGMKTLIKRAKIINSILKIESEINSGTTLNLTTPVSYEV